MAALHILGWVKQFYIWVQVEQFCQYRVLQEQRKAENEGVTEDDVNEIKNDISAFR